MRPAGAKAAEMLHDHASAAAGRSKMLIFGRAHVGDLTGSSMSACMYLVLSAHLGIPVHTYHEPLRAISNSLVMLHGNIQPLYEPGSKDNMRCAAACERASLIASLP